MPNTRTFAELRQQALEAVRDADPNGPGGVRMQAAKLLRDRTRGARYTLGDLLSAVEWAQQQVAEPDPLRELAEWLASKDWQLPALRGLPDAAAEQLAEAITRAREALGRKD